MVIEQIFNLITLILNKQRRGYVKTSQKLTAVKQAQIDFFNKEVERYRKVGFIPASIKKFIRQSEITLTNGVASLPPDFAQEITFETDSGSQGLFLSPAQYRDRMLSVILVPDQENPIAKLQDNTIIVQPDEFGSIQLVHFRLPVDPEYATTVSGDGRSEVFNEGGSTDVEFSQEFAGDIARTALAYLGIAFQNEEAFQLAIAQAQNDNAK